MGRKSITALLLIALPAPALAQSSAVLSAGETPGTGRVAINIAAGSGNQEANAATVAAGTVVATPTTLQQVPENAATGLAASAAIADNAMAGSSGLIAVNVAAGSANQLANLAVIAIGIVAPIASEPLLEQARASQQPPGSPGGSPSPHAEADLSSSAFAGSTGLVQANVVGGERNSASNTFVLTLEAGE